LSVIGQDKNDESIDKRIEYENGDKYWGPIVNGFREGLGILTIDGGNAEVVGYWERGFLDEGGIKYYENGIQSAEYFGDIKDYKAHGFGEITWKKGSKFYGDKYEGSFQFGMKWGAGDYTYKNGDAFSGRWIFDERYGTGKYKTNSGNFYVGEWREDKRDGLGLDYKPNGDNFAGFWEKDKRDISIIRQQVVSIKPQTQTQTIPSKKINKVKSAPKRISSAYLTDQKSVVGGSICYYSDGSSTKIKANYCPRKN
tara:strand:+ start:1063 stop:1824 length:762 start_codon:yes stop_codon:yes gene_type:complete